LPILSKGAASNSTADKATATFYIAPSSSTRFFDRPESGPADPQIPSNQTSLNQTSLNRDVNLFKNRAIST
jgi:hypothetical protein